MMPAAYVFLGLAIVAAAVVFVSVRAYQVSPRLVGAVFKYGLVLAIAGAFSIAALAIGLRVESRHDETYARSIHSVNEIWGGEVVQCPPTFYYEGTTTEQYLDPDTHQYRFRTKAGQITTSGLEAQEVTARIRKSLRTKGLLEFPGYHLTLSATYTLRNSSAHKAKYVFLFPLPTGAGNITGISVQLDGKEYTGDSNLADGVEWQGELSPGEARTVRVSYEAQGTGQFTYALASANLEMRRLDVRVETDFADFIIPDGSMVSTGRQDDGATSVLTWNAQKLVTRQNVALRFEIPPSSGKLVSKLFLCAPLSVFLFLGFLLVFCAARRIQLHPVHYLFVLTSFFIFYLLGSYLVSYMKAVLAIGVSLAVSTAILEYYLFLTGKGKALMASAGAGLLVFQWCYAAAFFLPEHTGFLITLASIVAFLVLVTMTGKVDWTRDGQPAAAA